MKPIEIKGSMGVSNIFVGETLQNLKAYLPSDNVVIITDENVAELYKDQFPPYQKIVIGTGETVKTLDTAKTIYQQLLDLEAQRSTFIVGIGGGIVCDIAGFIASTYLRGVRFGFVSSTLLSQVDASVGGKNGVNFEGFKNMVGVFNQPEFVICDLNLLKTLPKNEILCGLGEIVKHAAIEDADLFDFIDNNASAILNLDLTAIERLVYDSVMIKSTIVNRDEKEKGERRKLNFGHTFGHAIEKTTGLPHGQAVSIGMVLAAMISVKKGLLAQDAFDRLVALLKKLDLPVELTVDKESIVMALKKDKKREGEDIHFVLINEIGQSVIESISMQAFNELIS